MDCTVPDDENVCTMNPTILIVVTSHTALGDTGTPTGFWLEELAVPYRLFVAAVCHGPAVLAQVKNPAGEPLVRGRRFTGFSDEEEAAMELTRVVPFLIESTLKAQGGRYERAAMWQPHVVRDGRLVTGQNPA